MTQPLSMFPRGTGPLASFLIPSRGRPEALRKTLLSIHALAKDKNSYEILIKADLDDLATVEVAREVRLSRHVNVATISSPRGQGFYDFPLWVDRLAKEAIGDWLLLLNDDAVIVTPEWDDILLRSGTKAPHFGYESVFMFQLRTKGDPSVNAFPCLRRQTFEILGYFSPVLACDTWLSRVMNALFATSVVPIEVAHEREAHEEGETRRVIKQANEYMGWQLTCVEGLRKHVAAVDKLVTWLEASYASLEWLSQPQGNGWYWWKAAPVALDRLVRVRDTTAMMLPHSPEYDICMYEAATLGGWWAKVPGWRKHEEA